MDTKKTKKDSPIPVEPGEPNRPVKVFRIEDVSVSVFARDREIDGSTITFYSVSLSRSYVAANGKRMYVKTFDADDLGTLAALIPQASEYIRGLTQEEENA